MIPLRRGGMAMEERTFAFDVDRTVEHLDRILQMELAGVIYYTHYSFMIYGHTRIPITSWLRDNAMESLVHAQEAGQMIMRLHKRPKLGIAALPITQHNTIDAILTESIQREQDGVQLYRDLLALIKDKSVVLEEYATRVIAAEAVHIREMELMLMKQAPEKRAVGDTVSCQSIFVVTRPNGTEIRRQTSANLAHRGYHPSMRTS